MDVWTLQAATNLSSSTFENVKDQMCLGCPSCLVHEISFVTLGMSLGSKWGIAICDQIKNVKNLLAMKGNVKD
jgi:hypothetical protein